MTVEGHRSHIQPDSIRIDCQGVRIAQPVLNVECKGRLFQFVLDEELRNTNTFHAGLFVNLHANSQDSLRYPRPRRFCALLESPINACYADIETFKERYSLIFTHQRKLIEQGDKFQKLMFGTNWVNVISDQDAERHSNQTLRKSQNISFMGSILHEKIGAYSFRREVAEFAVRHPSIDCFGKGINEIPSKHAALESYRFSIAMENAASDFYFSEKLIDCVLTDTVPIYYGCPSITELLDPRGLLTFSNLAELSEIVDKATPVEYERMLPFITSNKKRIIENEWHSHLSLFRRISSCLVDRLDNAEPPIPPAEKKNRLRRLVDSLLNRFK